MTGEDTARILDWLRTLDGEQIGPMLRRLSPRVRRELMSAWRPWAHAGQLAPAGDWRVWLIRAGRGFGKTRAGAEWVSQVARDNPAARIALVGATAHDAVQVMVRGASGLMAVAATGERVRFRPTRGEVEFASGATAQIFSAEAPDSLRGPEHGFAWCDELAKWRRGEETWDNLLMGLRGGTRPQVVVTTTPRPTALMRRVMKLPGLVETRGRTADNRHLPPAFLTAVEAAYAGTRLGRQELDGELIDDVAGALWPRDLIEACRVEAAPPLARVVVGVDPPASAQGDACGIVAVGLGEDGIGYLVEDASVAGLTPDGWAARVCDCARRHRADRVVAEVNQGGDMVLSVLQAADRTLPVAKVHATTGKVRRAEPVSLLYAGGRVKHAGRFPTLEDELAGLQAAGGYAGPGRSPDRADALVWALSELMLGQRGAATVREL